MIIEIDFLYRWAVLERRPNHVNKQPSGCWHLTFDCFLNLDMRDDTNTKFLLLRVQTAYDLGNERWLFGDIIDHVGIYGSRLAEGLSASNVGLVGHTGHKIDDLNPIWARLLGWSQLWNPSNLPCLYIVKLHKTVGLNGLNVLDDLGCHKQIFISNTLNSSSMQYRTSLLLLEGCIEKLRQGYNNYWFMLFPIYFSLFCSYCHHSNITNLLKYFIHSFPIAMILTLLDNKHK